MCNSYFMCTIASMLERVAGISRFAGPVFAGLYAGVLLTLMVLEAELRRFDGSVYTRVAQVNLIGIPWLAGATLIPATLCAAVLVIVTIRRPGRARWWASSALLLLLTVFIISSAVNVQITAAEGRWDLLSPPPDWAVQRDHWQIAHAIRTAASVAAFLCLSVLTFGNGPTTAPHSFD
nr:anthrone oxygenase family protein [Nocardia spumae]